MDPEDALSYHLIRTWCQLKASMQSRHLLNEMRMALGI